MKLKKVIGTVILFIMLISILSVFSNTNAKTVNYKLGIVRLRKSGYGYKIDPTSGVREYAKTIWKIVSHENGTVNYDKAIYCIKAGQGFGDAWTSENVSGTVDYKIAYDLKDEKETIKSKFSEISMFNNDTTYSEVLWILDNMYITGKTDKKSFLSKVPTKSSTEEISNVWTEMNKTSSSTLDDLTDEEIEVVQQLAIWYFTNNEDANYNRETLTTILQNEIINTDATYKSFADKYNENDEEGNHFDYGDFKQDYMASLYTYLITEAKKHTDYTGTVGTTESPLKLNKDSVVTISKDANGNYIAGPFKIERKNEGEYTDFVAEFTNQAGEKITKYKVLDSNKAETTSSIEDLIGNNFYISIAKEDINKLDTIKLSISLSFAKTKTTFLTTEEQSYRQEQPVVIVEKTIGDDSDSIESKIFDLALRKFITKVDNTVLTGTANDREPRISESEKQLLAEGKDTTAKKEHTKDAVLVNTGSIVTYTIRVYNEGDTAGYAKEITDYLPEGLEFYSSVVDGTDYNWKMLDKDGKETTDKTKAVKLTTDYLQNTLLNEYDKENLKLACADVKVMCKVVEETKQTAQNLRNIAAITKNADKDGNDITDRDSKPTDLTDNEVKNYPFNPDNSKKDYEDDDDYEPLLIPGKNIDLALRKFITEVNGVKQTVSREPQVDTSTISVTGTATYNHTKLPVTVKIGDIVTYTIRVYNEGDLDGYVSEITDFLPEYLEYINENNAKTTEEKAAAKFNENFLWEVVSGSNGRKVKTTITSKEHSDTYNTLTGIKRNDTLLTAFDGGKTLSYIDVQIKCKVKTNAVQNKRITNIAEITGMTDWEGTEVKKDRDSTANNVNLPSDSELPTYKDNEINKPYVPGQEDDDDFEKLEIKIFDLALKKFITQVNNKDITDRIPTITKNADKTLSYSLTPEPLGVKNGDYVYYTIRIYNEGEINGYASEITDDLPEGLEFLPTHTTNKDYRWVMRDEKGNEVNDVSKAKIITTDYLSKEQEDATGRNNLIKAYDKDAAISTTKPFNPDYKEVIVVFKVIEPNTSNRILVNVAQISEDEDENGHPVEDIDSIPNRDEQYNFNGDNEDDIDYERVKLLYFDLALRKFITAVNDTPYNNRYPDVKYENGKIKYEHTKDPVRVENGNIVTYTIRVYNEGKIAGYAKEVMDDIPEGLEFLPENNTNKEYRWVMYKQVADNSTSYDYEYGNKKYKETDDAKEADVIVTDYLSKDQEKETGRDNLIKAFDEKAGITDKNPDYRDVKVAFKVTEPNTSDRIIINTAEISEDEDEDGNPIDDVDSTPANNKEGEDDIDIEKIYVKYFDLSLLKWVTQAIVTIDGKTTVTETGHTGEENPEPVVKVELKEKKISKYEVKFKYKIKVTNEGEIAGYAKEVTDYIPEGLKFVKEDNPEWYERKDGVVATDQLADVLLKPGESATVEIILTWINGANNMGVKWNIAEISKDYNDSNTPDIDSTPDNKKEGEDDIDDAPVMLTPQTGEIRIYYVLIGSMLLVMIIGISLIKKYVLE